MVWGLEGSRGRPLHPEEEKEMTSGDPWEKEGLFSTAPGWGL